MNDHPRRRRVELSDWAALVAFALVLAAALALYIVHGRSQWFFLDEWDYLANRRLTDVGDLLRPHNEHWSTLPIIEYRVLFRLFGLRTYLPYQIVAIVAHLFVAALLRVVMRRAGVQPWIATAAASLFALLGAANQNIVWAFQAAWSATLVLGLIQLLLADHDGPLSRRDWLGVGAGTASLLSTGVAVPLVAAVGLTVLLRRGWKAALFHTGPPAVVFVVWWSAFGREGYRSTRFAFRPMVEFWRDGLENTFTELGQAPAVGALIAGVMVAGLALAFTSGYRMIHREFAAPFGMLVGASVFLLFTAIGRAGIESPRAGRYLHVGAALTLPAAAFAADAIARRWRLLMPALLGMFIVGIPGNIQALAERDEGRGRLALGQEEFVRTVPTLRIADQLRDERKVIPRSPEVTMGWLRARVSARDLEPLVSPDPRLLAFAAVAVGLEQTDTTTWSNTCQTLEAPVARRLRAGEVLSFRGGSLRVFANGGGLAFILYDPREGRAITVDAGPLDVRLASDDPEHPAVVCG